MKTLLTLLVLLSFSITTYSQAYVDFSVDPNNMFNIVDNPRMENESPGLDFDLEVGAVDQRVGVYIFYGAYYAIDYQNYGFGTDYYFYNREKVNLSAGIGLSVIMRKYHIGIYDKTGWGQLFGSHIRTQAMFWMNDNIGIVGTIQYQRRPDLDIDGIIEGKIGLRVKFNRNR